jgi:methylated-DNA-[protein]-cysteine S-methyltransferase
MGPLAVAATEEGLVSVRWATSERGRRVAAAAEDVKAGAILDVAERWLRAYFTARRSLPPLPRLAPQGTSFQRDVWSRLAVIPFGRVLTYGEIAAALGLPGAARAVGQANGKNPLPIFIPCHRVVAGGGKLGGYSAGLERKRWLLAHEGIGPDLLGNG